MGKINSVLRWLGLEVSEDTHRAKYKPNKFTGSLNSPESAEKHFRRIWNKDLLTKQEEVYVIYVNDKNQILYSTHLNRGGSDWTHFCLHSLFRYAYRCNATGMFIAHNHPKGSLKVSTKDEDTTNKVRIACKLLEFRLLDHIILTKNSYVSFTEEGFLEWDKFNA